jgi:hypothetical protein
MKDVEGLFPEGSGVFLFRREADAGLRGGGASYVMLAGTGVAVEASQFERTGGEVVELVTVGWIDGRITATVECAEEGTEWAKMEEWEAEAALEARCAKEDVCGSIDCVRGAVRRE